MNIVRWLLGIFFALVSLVYLSESIPTSIMAVLLAILLIPPAEKFVTHKLKFTVPRSAKIVAGLVLFVILMMVTPSSKTKSSVTIASPSPTEKIIMTKSAPTPIPTVVPSNTATPTRVPTSKPTLKPLPTNTPYIEPTAVYIPPTQSTSNDQDTSTSNSGAYACDCSKTCTEITSCAEAQYQLNTCGCSQRDADHDGIACDGAPLKCQN